MTRDDIIRMAREADAYADGMDTGAKNYIGLRDEYFAALRKRRQEQGLVRLEVYAHLQDHGRIKRYAKRISSQRVATKEQT